MAYTPPPEGEFRFTMPGATHPITLRVIRTTGGAVVMYAGRRWAGVVTAGGQLEGKPWLRVALERLTNATRVVRCKDCRRELTDDASRARGVGPDCWAARQPA